MKVAALPTGYSGGVVTDMILKQ